MRNDCARAESDFSSPIQLRPASRNTAWSPLVLQPLRSTPVMSNGRQPPDGFFPGAAFAPRLQRRACSQRQRPVGALVDNGGRLLPIVPRIFPESPSNVVLSRSFPCALILLAPGHCPAGEPWSCSASQCLFPLPRLSYRRFARAEPQTHPITNPARLALPAQRDQESQIESDSGRAEHRDSRRNQHFSLTSRIFAPESVTWNYSARSLDTKTRKFRINES